MGLSYGGELTLGAIMPSTVSAVAEATADANAKLTGAATLQASLSVTPPTVASQIAFLTTFLAQLTAGVTAGVPNVSFDLTACANLIASLNATLSALVALDAVLGTGGVFAYTYSGAMSALGASLTTEFATQYRDGTPSSTSGESVIFVAHASGSITALASLFSGA